MSHSLAHTANALHEQSSNSRHALADSLPCVNMSFLMQTCKTIKCHYCCSDNYASRTIHYGMQFFYGLLDPFIQFNESYFNQFVYLKNKFSPWKSSCRFFMLFPLLKILNFHISITSKFVFCKYPARRKSIISRQRKKKCGKLQKHIFARQLRTYNHVLLSIFFLSVRKANYFRKPNQQTLFHHIQLSQSNVRASTSSTHAVHLLHPTPITTAIAAMINIKKCVETFRRREVKFMAKVNEIKSSTAQTAQAKR